MKNKRLVIRISHRKHSYKIRRNTAIVLLAIFVAACCILMFTVVAHAEANDVSRDDSIAATSVSLQAEEQAYTQQEQQEEEIKVVGWFLAAVFLFGLCLMGVTLKCYQREHEEEMTALRTECYEYKARADRAEKHYRDLKELYEDLRNRNDNNVILYNALKDAYDKLEKESRPTA